MKEVIVEKGTYADSLYTMLLGRELKQKNDLLFVFVGMGNPSNIASLAKEGFDPAGLEKIHPEDLVIAYEYEDDRTRRALLSEIEGFLLGIKSASEGLDEVPASLEEAFASDSDANLAIISVPGQFASYEARKALGLGMHVLLFSDHVSLEEEMFLKDLAIEKGLLFMGAGCRGAILGGTGLCFANAVARGPVGIIDATGTGMQEVSCLLDRLGYGVSQAIGIGKRDLQGLKATGTETLLAIFALGYDPMTEVLVLVAPLPPQYLADTLLGALKQTGKPAVVHFQGTKVEFSGEEPLLDMAENLQETAMLAAARIAPEPQGLGKIPNWPFDLDPKSIDKLVVHETARMQPVQRYVRCYFSGSGFCEEAVSVLADLPEGIWSNVPSEPARMLYNPYHSTGHTVLDLGDGFFSVGKEHPAIDPLVRTERVEAELADPTIRVMVFDCILGCGSCDNPAKPLAAVISKAKERARERGGYLSAIVSVTGTDKDRQVRRKQIALLEQAQAIVMPTNYQAVRLAKRILLRVLGLGTQHVQTYSHRLASQPVPFSAGSEPAFMLEPLLQLFAEGPKSINVGLRSFSKESPSCNGKNRHVFWSPPAGGQPGPFDSLCRIARQDRGKIEAANGKAMDKILASVPMLRGIDRAGAVIPGMRKNLVLHAGPPVSWDQMCATMKKAVVSGLIHEGLAETSEEAAFLADSGEIDFGCTHTYGVVGPVAGVVTQSMPVWIVQNETFGNLAYAPIHEGSGKALRNGNCDTEVLERLSWMGQTFASVMQEAIERHGPVDLRELVSRALLMGDECHVRNHAASTMFLAKLGPSLVLLKREKQAVSDVLAFMEGDDQFFLNLAMASCKCTMDAARGIPCGSIVTAMAGNGIDFGIQIAAFKDRWFVAPAPKADGVYSCGYSSSDANADIGDSAIAETLGLGGFSLAAAPSVAKCIGGSAADASAVSRRMYRISCGESEGYRLPPFDFRGSPTGIDIRAVVERGVLPLVDTMIQHKDGETGVIGAGLVQAPMECFVKAISAYADAFCRI
jgi:succinyl-CoA synthetase alpha subunit